MIIVAIITLLVIVLAGWAICAAIPRGAMGRPRTGRFLEKMEEEA